MPDTEAPLVLFTVRAGTGSFRVVTHKASLALAHVADMHERGLQDVHVEDLHGARCEVSALEELARAEAAAPFS